jgi:hypothetical protein
VLTSVRVLRTEVVVGTEIDVVVGTYCVLVKLCTRVVVVGTFSTCVKVLLCVRVLRNAC